MFHTPNVSLWSAVISCFKQAIPTLVSQPYIIGHSTRSFAGVRVICPKEEGLFLSVDGSKWMLVDIGSYCSTLVMKVDGGWWQLTRQDKEHRQFPTVGWKGHWPPWSSVGVHWSVTLLANDFAEIAAYCQAYYWLNLGRSLASVRHIITWVWTSLNHSRSLCLDWVCGAPSRFKEACEL